MAKVHKSLRVDEETAAAVSALQVDGETEAAAYNRVIAAGVEALNSGGTVEEPTAGGDGAAALIEALRAHIETLKAENGRIGEQMAIKDRQIEALSVLTAQAQQATAKALEPPQPQQQSAQGGEQQDGEQQRRGFWARLFG